MRAFFAAVIACGSIAYSPLVWADTAAVFRMQPLPADERGGMLHALYRGPRVLPLRYRVIVVPGSGCAGMGPIASRYFAGLLHAAVLVLHKPTVNPDRALAPDQCPPDFVQGDALFTWQTQAMHAVQSWLEMHSHEQALPTWLVGISEGGEIVPALAALVPPSHLVGLVLLSSSGLDPREAAQLQAQRLGHRHAWDALAALLAREDVPDDALAHGRSMRYWRDLWRWPLAQALIDSPGILLHVWGDADALLPPLAYERFAKRVHAQGRTHPFCSHRLHGADHGLQSPQRDGVQWLWAQLERHARYGWNGCAEGFFEAL